MGTDKTPRSILTQIGGWKLGRTLGRGAYAHVRLATHHTGHRAACKILPALHRLRSAPATWDETVDAVEAHKELVLLKAMAGAGLKGVVGLEGVIEEGGWSYVFLTLYERSVSSVTDREWPKNLAIRFFRHLLLSVQSLHSLDISHEDLKRSNVLMDKEGLPIIVDFGFSHFSPGGGFVKSAGGTLDYSSPEKVLDSLYDPKANDVWALGILFTKLLGIQHPFISAGRQETSSLVKQRIIQGQAHFEWQDHHLMEGGLADLILGMLNRDPIQRLTIPQILMHPFLNTPHNDPPQYRPPSYRLPEDVPSPLPTAVVEDVAFMAYLHHNFHLCETYKVTRGRILGSEPCWEKRWAGMLFRWKQREDLEWEDIPRSVATSSYSSRQRQLRAASSLGPKPLREIHLSPNVSKAIVPGFQAQETPLKTTTGPRKSLIGKMKGKDGSLKDNSPLSHITVRVTRAVRRAHVNSAQKDNFGSRSPPPAPEMKRTATYGKRNGAIRIPIVQFQDVLSGPHGMTSDLQPRHATEATSMAQASREVSSGELSTSSSQTSSGYITVQDEHGSPGNVTGQEQFEGLKGTRRVKGRLQKEKARLNKQDPAEPVRRSARIQQKGLRT